MFNRENTSEHYKNLSEQFPEILSALENLGNTVRSHGPLGRSTSELIQLAASIAVQSEGAVHSHTRRAKQAGASESEIYHTAILLISTIGFPKVAAGISWIKDILTKEEF